MNDELDELAVLYALGHLTGTEEARARSLMADDANFRNQVLSYQETLADLALVSPEAPLRPGLKQQILQALPPQERKSLAAEPRPVSQRQKGFLMPWILCSLATIAAVWFWNEQQRLSSEVEILAGNAAQMNRDLATTLDRERDLRGDLSQSKTKIDELVAQVDGWEKKDALAQVQIATLQSSLEEYRQGVAVVIWDSEKQEGVLKLEKMPPVAADKDYQLWVVDPKKKDPVDAGVVRVDEQGFARFTFKPVVPITEAGKFALSVEKEGGVPKGEGPIILIGP